MVDTYFTKIFLIKAHMIVSTSKIILEFTVTMIISAEYLTCIIIFQVSSTVQKIQIRRFSGYSFPIPTILYILHLKDFVVLSKSRRSASLLSIT